MKSRDFCYWLQGLFELAEPGTLDEKQVRTIRNHLNMVFFHEIDPSYGGEGVQRDLDRLHKGTLVISAFPGCGKSYYHRQSQSRGLTVLDSDSSKFDKSDFPRNYIEHIKENIGKADVILVSSHKDVRDALVENRIPFTLVYPELSLKDEWLQRYIDRGSPEIFISLLSEHWELWIGELDEQTNCDKVKLKEGEYLSDVIDRPPTFPVVRKSPRWEPLEVKLNC